MDEEESFSSTQGKNVFYDLDMIIGDYSIRRSIKVQNAWNAFVYKPGGTNWSESPSSVGKFRIWLGV